MNDDRLFRKNESAFRVLMRLDCPFPVIENYLDISRSTIYKYLKRLEKKATGADKLAPSTGGKPEMLKLLAYFHYPVPGLVPPGLKKNLNREKFLSVLNEFLQIEETKKSLELSCRHLRSLNRFSFAADVPLPYQKLMRLLEEPNENYFTVKALWNNYLKKIAAADIIAPSEEEFQKNGALAEAVLLASMSLSKKYIAPEFSLRLCTLVDEVLLHNLSPREESIIRSLCGFNGKHSLKTVGDNFDISGERVRVIKERLIRILRRRLPAILALPLDWDKVFELSQAKVTDLVNEAEFKRQLKEKQGRGKHRLSDLKLGARARHALYAAQIEYLEDLTELKPQELKAWRNLGKKTYDEITSVLHQHQLDFMPDPRFDSVAATS